MNYFSSNSFNYFFSFAHSEDDILYGALDIGLVTSIKFIEYSISLLGGKSGISLGKTFEKFWTTAIFFNSTSSFISIENNNKYPKISFIKGSLFELVGDFKRFSEFRNITNFSIQFKRTWLEDNQSIPKITSNWDNGRHTRFTRKFLFSMNSGKSKQTILVITESFVGVETIKLVFRKEINRLRCWTQ